MSVQEDLLRQTLAKVHDAVAPTPELLSDIRAAIAAAERRRRIVNVAVIAGVFVLTIVILLLLSWFRMR